MYSPAILEFELEEGRHVSAEIAGRALIDWVAAIREANNAIDPDSDIIVDLLSAEPACLRFSAIMKFIDQDVLGKASKALDEVPNIKKLVALNVLILPGAVVGGLTVNVLSSPPSIEEQVVSRDPQVKDRVQSFYKTVNSDPAIKRVVIKETADGPPIMSVGRAEFAERSGLWESQVEDAQEKRAIAEWDVVVTHPVALGRPLTWGFMRDGLPFRAKMKDEKFLAAIRSGTLPITIQEGVVMKVQVSYLQRLEGQLWIPVKGSYRIDEVISPAP